MHTECLYCASLYNLMCKVSAYDDQSTLQIQAIDKMYVFYVVMRLKLRLAHIDLFKKKEKKMVPNLLYLFCNLKKKKSGFSK